MNKIVCVMFMAVICSSCCGIIGKEILQGMFDAFSFKQQIGENCLGQKFEELMKPALQSLDILLTDDGFDLIEKMIFDFTINCPVLEFVNHIDSLVQKKIEDKTILNNFIPKIKISLQHFIDLIKFQNLNPKSFGTKIGLMYYTFLQEEEMIDVQACKTAKISLFNILKGFIKGLSKDQSSTKCYDNVASHRELVTNFVKESLNSFMTQKNPLEKLEITQFTELLNIAGDCRLFHLMTAILNFSTSPHLDLMKKAEQFENDIGVGIFGVEVIKNIYEEKDFEIGYTVGEAFQKMFDFYVD